MTHHQVLSLLISRSSSAEKSFVCWPTNNVDKQYNNPRRQVRRHQKLENATIRVHTLTDEHISETPSYLSQPHRQVCDLLTVQLPLKDPIVLSKLESMSITAESKPAKGQQLDSPAVDSVDRSLSLVNLPSEIIHQILLWLPAISLYAVSLTCKSLNAHTMTDSLWENILDSPDLPTPHPYLNYRSLHHALSPQLYLKRKVFIGDRRHFGSLLLTKYMPTTGTLEGYSLIATQPTRNLHLPTAWSYDPDTTIEPFHPIINLRKDPDLKISPNSKASEDGEIPVQRRGIFATYFRAEAIYEKDLYPQMAVWPSRTIPAATRVRNQSSNGFRNRSQARQRSPFMRLPSNVSINGTSVSIGGLISVNDSAGAAVDRSAFLGAPNKHKEDADPNAKWRSEERKVKSGFLSEKAFRLRKWAILGDQEGDVDNRVRMGEMVETFAELDEELWTPTKEYPLRGIWVGDYSAHGAEFMLFHQPAVSSGNQRLEIIKLTGDPNVPRGEYSVIVDDMTTPVRVADEDEHEWPGAKVYKARGQIANTDFRDSSFLECNIIIPDPERDWNIEEEKRLKSLAKTNPDSIERDEAQQSGNIGEGWGVGVSERRDSVASSVRKKGRRGPNYMKEPWVQKRVALDWRLLSSEITFYERVDIDKFLDN